jgi:tetratricopeptide (TPR) repeat protein
MKPRFTAVASGAVVVFATLLFACAASDSAGTAPLSDSDKVSAAPAGQEELPMGTLGAYLAGRHAQYGRDYGAAAEFYGRALTGDPDDVELMNRTLLLEVSEGRIGEAVRIAPGIVAIQPESPIAALVLLLDDVKRGDFAAAEAKVAAMPQDGVHRFVGPLLLAWAKEGRGQPVPAIAALQPLAEIRGFQPLRDFHAALIADLAGRTQEAEENYLKVVNATPRVNWRSVEMLGNLYERTGRPEQARALYERFIKDNPDSEFAEPALARVAAGQVPPPRLTNAREGIAEGLFDLASVLNQGETSDLALLYGRLALDLRPDFPLAQLLVAEILEAQQRPADALTVLRTIDRASPFGWSARLRETADLDAIGKTDEAIDELKSMAADRPTRPQPLFELGDLLRTKSRFGEAVEAYDAAIARLPGGDVEPRQWTLLYSRAITLERSGQWGRAETDLKRALELQPEQPLVLNYLGYSWIDRGEHLDEALKMVERAVQFRPNDGYIVDSLGWAHYRLGDYGKAAEILERAVEMKPQDPTINDHLGDAYWQSGRQAEAKAQWQRALLFNPEAGEVKTIEAKLDRGLDKPTPAGPATARGGG